MESRRKTRREIVILAAAWMLVAQAGWAQAGRELDGSEKVPTLPATGASTPINVSP
jgi:hypothetical protein